jgi:hypothetical protein
VEEEKRKEAVDPDSFGGFVERKGNDKRRKLMQKTSSSKTDHLEDMMLDTQGGALQLRQRDGNETNLLQELR